MAQSRILLCSPSLAVSAFLLCAAAWPAAASGQDQSGSREVVQPLPSAASQELKDALSRLARNPRNVDALIAAGTASLELDDVDAAVGFFGRADQLVPGDPRVKAGKAAAFVRTRRPVEALKLFEEAESGGVEIVRLAGDYGLAFDLVGRNGEAQAAYRRALAREESDEVTRRLALSYAIDGNAEAFERALRPLLARRDFAAYRARAFGLAIMGRADDAVAIAEAVMPRTLSRKMEPYLRYMPRLTKAQQAAAANLGIYPTASQIGRDDPRIVAVGGVGAGTTPVRTADSGLAPSGAPLGEAATTIADSGAVAASDEAERRVRIAQVDNASDPLARTRTRPRVVRASPEEAQAAPAPQETAVPIAPATTVAASEPPARSAEQQLASRDEPAPDAAPGFDLARVAGSTTTPQPEEPASTLAEAPDTSEAATAAAPSKPVSLADAFADFAAQPAPETAPAAGAVDISSIDAPREVARPPEPEPPAHPSRFWVQVATGRDRSALRFDWRRITRSADGLLDGKGPFVTPWGQTNRLLAGPYDTRGEARNMLNSLQEKGIDAFAFTSPEGQEVESLR